MLTHATITFRLPDLVLCIFAGNRIGVRFEHALYNTSEGQFVVLVRLVSDRPFPVSGSIRIMPMELDPVSARGMCIQKYVQGVLVNPPPICV